MFKNFNTENWLSFLSIGVPVIVSAIGFIISLVLSHFADRNKSRPVILISLKKYHKNGFYNTDLIIKNYGQTIGTIISVEINPLYKQVEGNDEFEPNGFTNFKNFPLAPGQAITTMIASGTSAKLIETHNRNFTIKYKPDFFKIRPYTEKYTIDEINYPTIYGDGNFILEKRVEELTNNLEKDLELLKQGY